jgi:hypothetical protein
MKYLNSAAVDTLNTQTLQRVDLGHSILSASINIFSCKYVRAEAELKLALNTLYQHSPLLCPLGRLADPHTRSTLFHLIAALNWTFTDYQFDLVHPTHFTHIHSFTQFRERVNTHLVKPLTEAHNDFSATFWNIIEQESIELHNSEFYMFTPSDDCELFSGAITSFVYYVFNRKHKRMILLSGATTSKLHASPTRIKE